MFSDDLGLKARLQEISPLVKPIYNTPDHPNFMIFCLEEAVAIFADFSGAAANNHTVIGAGPFVAAWRL